MFGRAPRLPIDIAFGFGEAQQSTTTTKYATDLRERLKSSYEAAVNASKKSQNKQKSTYDIKAKGASIIPGDRVLVRKLAFEGKHKIADRWEEYPYTVLSQPDTAIPVFVDHT